MDQRAFVRGLIVTRTAAAAVAAHTAPDEQCFALYEKFLLQQNEGNSQEVRPDSICKIAA